MTQVVLVCGGRAYPRADYVWSVLDQLHAHIAIAKVVQGGATGADGAARGWAMSRGVPCVTVDADWNRHGRAAGPIRNQQMLDEHKPDLVVGFPGGAGTRDMLSRARKAGRRVERYDLAHEAIGE